MSLCNWVRRVRPNARQTRPRCLPTIEALEDRLTPAVTAQFDWSTPPRFGRDANLNGRIDVFNDPAFIQASAVAVQADGKIVVAGYTDRVSYSNTLDFALVRYNADGSLAPSFGSGGKVVTAFAANFSSTAYGVAIQQPDGKIVAAGAGYDTTPPGPPARAALFSRLL